MSISSETVLSALFTYAPQFYSTDPDILAGYQTLYNLVGCQINPNILSCCGVSVYAFLMAHYLTIAAAPTTGMQSNMTEGHLSIGFNVNPDMQALNLTPYGRMYIDLVRRTVVGSTVTNLPPQFGGINNNVPGLTCGCSNGFWAGGGGCGCGCGGC
jgi:hypothetical protein